MRSIDYFDPTTYDVSTYFQRGIHFALKLTCFYLSYNCMFQIEFMPSCEYYTLCCRSDRLTHRFAESFFIAPYHIFLNQFSIFCPALSGQNSCYDTVYLKYFIHKTPWAYIPVDLRGLFVSLAKLKK